MPDNPKGLSWNDYQAQLQAVVQTIVDVQTKIEALQQELTEAQTTLKRLTATPPGGLQDPSGGG